MDQTGISEAVGRESRVLLLPLSSPAMKSNKKCSSLDQLSFLLFRKLMEKPRVSSRKEKLNKNVRGICERERDEKDRKEEREKLMNEENE